MALDQAAAVTASWRGVEHRLTLRGRGKCRHYDKSCRCCCNPRWEKIGLHRTVVGICYPAGHRKGRSCESIRSDNPSGWWLRTRLSFRRINVKKTLSRWSWVRRVTNDKDKEIPIYACLLFLSISFVIIRNLQVSEVSNALLYVSDLLPKGR